MGRGHHSECAAEMRRARPILQPTTIPWTGPWRMTLGAWCQAVAVPLINDQARDMSQPQPGQTRLDLPCVGLVSRPAIGIVVGPCRNHNRAGMSFEEAHESLLDVPDVAQIDLCNSPRVVAQSQLEQE